ncbi:MAG: protein phosphatase 2C domain-containing protein [Deltaproteobacteria bacterium]|jgi:hypothetical protein|nr:protein phosphatase 2C domain-containing protein [Deltaproteobacteria bacterium]
MSEISPIRQELLSKLQYLKTNFAKLFEKRPDFSDTVDSIVNILEDAELLENISETFICYNRYVEKFINYINERKKYFTIIKNKDDLFYTLLDLDTDIINDSRELYYSPQDEDYLTLCLNRENIFKSVYDTAHQEHAIFLEIFKFGESKASKFLKILQTDFKEAPDLIPKDYTFNGNEVDITFTPPSSDYDERKKTRFREDSPPKGQTKTSSTQSVKNPEIKESTKLKGIPEIKERTKITERPKIEESPKHEIEDSQVISPRKNLDTLFWEKVDESQAWIGLKINPKFKVNDPVIKLITATFENSSIINGYANSPLIYSLNVLVNTDYSITECCGNKFLFDRLNLRLQLDKIKSDLFQILNIFGTPDSTYSGKIGFFIFYENDTSSQYQNLQFEKDLFIKEWIAPEEVSPKEKSVLKDSDSKKSGAEEISPQKIDLNDPKEISEKQSFSSHRFQQVIQLSPFINKIAFVTSQFACKTDSYDITQVRNCVIQESVSGWSIFAVSDVLKDSIYSPIGASIACKTAVSKFGEFMEMSEIASFINKEEKQLDKWKDFFVSKYPKGKYEPQNKFREIFPFDKIIYTVIYSAYENIWKDSKSRAQCLSLDKIEISKYSTTLLFLALKKFKFGYFFITFSIGDGLISIYNWHKKVTNPVNMGLFDKKKNNARTSFLTMIDEITPKLVKARTLFWFADKFDSLLMATNGVIQPFFVNNEPNFSNSLWEMFFTRKDSFYREKTSDLNNLHAFSNMIQGICSEKKENKTIILLR